MLSIAVIGAGRIGSIHARNIAAHDGARLAGVADVDAAAAARLAHECGARALSLDEAFAADAVRRGELDRLGPGACHEHGRVWLLHRARTDRTRRNLQKLARVLEVFVSPHARNRSQRFLHLGLGVGLIDASWLTKFPPELSNRLKQILDTPDD